MKYIAEQLELDIKIPNYIEAPHYDKIVNEQSLFLAGGITGVENWQRRAITKLKGIKNLTILNPRRENFEAFKNDAGFNESEIQIKWEYHHLHIATQVIFWFSHETVQPIALFELGARLSERQSLDLGEMPQEVFIGIHPNYHRKFDLLIQVPLHGYSKEHICDNLDSLIDRVMVYNKNLNHFKKLSLCNT